MQHQNKFVKFSNLRNIKYILTLQKKILTKFLCLETTM